MLQAQFFAHPPPPSSKLWYNRHLKYLANCRDRLIRRSRTQGASSNVLSCYRKMRNLYPAVLRPAERLYFKEVGRSLTSDNLALAQWWKKAKRACGWSGQQELQNGNIVSSTSDRAAVFCQQFQQQCSAFPPVTSSVFSKNDSSGQFEFKEITSIEVLTALRKLPSGESVGLDLISNELLKLGACSAVCSSLAMLLPEHQFDCLRRRSVEWQLLSVVERWHKALDQRHLVHAVFLDAAKAFDRVDHRLLLQSFYSLGI